MEINVSQLLKEPIGGTRHYELTETEDIDDSGRKRLVRAKVDLLRTQRGILVRAMVQTEAELSCSRCLNSFDYPVTLKIEEEFLPTIDIISGANLPPLEEPGVFMVDEHQVIDLTEAIRQYAVLAEPIKPLCREDCPGLCQTCGGNLNLGPCDCPPPVTDERWEKLVKLLHK